PAFFATRVHPSSKVSRRDTLSIRLCHFPPLTPLCRAANMASVQIEAGANFRCPQPPSAPASCLVVSDTADASISISASVRPSPSTFLPHFPDAPFALTHFPTVLRATPCSVLLGLRLPPAFPSPAGPPAYLVLPSHRSVLNHVVRHITAFATTAA